jgi:hypothetical protein
MRLPRRSAFSLAELLVLLACLALALGLLLPAVVKAREQARKADATKNLQQLGLACHNYVDAVGGRLPPGCDANNFSAAAYLLPYLEQEKLYKAIDFKKSVTDTTNVEARKKVIDLFLSPRDPLKKVSDDYGATNFLGNDQVLIRGVGLRFPAGIPDGTSNTILYGETLKGDGGVKAVDVKRQHVLLPKEALKKVPVPAEGPGGPGGGGPGGKGDATGVPLPEETLKPVLPEDAGVKEFKDNKGIAGDRCASWMDGRFLQGTFNGGRKPNDERPDVSCEGLGGLSALRSLDDTIFVALCDGSVKKISAKKISHVTWKNAVCPNDGNPLGNDW